MSDKSSRLIVALDVDTAVEARMLAGQLDPSLCRLKIGKQLFTREGPELVRALQRDGFDIFLDLKFHDIPSTVAQAVRAAADLGVWMVNVHASGGSRMMQAAVDALGADASRPLLIGVTVLTSFAESDLLEFGLEIPVMSQVSRLAGLAHDSGLDGVVCSAHEVPMLREALGSDFLLVTPGIRLAGDDVGDQRRVVTPKEAIALGSDYLVMGRSITGAADPAETAREVCASIDGN